MQILHRKEIRFNSWWSSYSCRCTKANSYRDVIRRQLTYLEVSCLLCKYALLCREIKWHWRSYLSRFFSPCTRKNCTGVAVIPLFNSSFVFFSRRRSSDVCLTTFIPFSKYSFYYHKLCRFSTSE